MKITPGKYLTRGGKIATVKVIDTLNKIVGGSIGEYGDNCWDHEGAYCGSDADHYFDLVSRLDDETPKGAKVMDRTTCGACGAWIGDDELQDLREEIERLRELEGTVRILSAAQTTLIAERESLQVIEKAARALVEHATFPPVGKWQEWWDKHTELYIAMEAALKEWRV